MSASRHRIGNRNTPFTARGDARWREYSRLKQEWIEAHPNATSGQIDSAARRIAKDLGL